MEKLFKGLLKYHWLTIGLVLIVSAVFLKLIVSNSYLETDLDKYMPQSHPEFIFSNQAEDWFHIKDGIIIAIENKEGIYHEGTLDKIKNLTKELQKMKEIEKSDVASLYTADNIVGSEMGLEVTPFYSKVPTTQSDLNRLQRDVRENEMIYGRFVSEDEQVALIIAQIGNDVFSQEFRQKLLDLTTEYEGPEKLYLAGRPIVEGSLAALASADMIKMVPIVILVIFIALLIILKSFKAAFFTFSVVLFSVLWSFGLMAATGIPVYAVSTMLPVMLIAIGVAYGIHLFNHLKMYLAINQEAKKENALKEMIHQMWRPVLMTSLTTAIGFISLLTSQVYPIKYFGLFAAFGVTAAMFFSLILLPAGVMVFGLPRWKFQKHQTHHKVSGLSRKFASLLIRFRKLSILFTFLIVLLSLWGMTRVWVDSSFLSMFEKSSSIAMTDKYINQKFGGTSTLNVIFDSKNPNAFKNPHVLKAMEELQIDVDGSLEIVGNSFALTDYLKRMNMVMNADDPQFNTIPDSQELIAQYLLLYEMSGDPENLEKVVDYNYQKANMTFQLKNDNSLSLKAVIYRIEKHEPALNKLGVSINYAGSGYKALIFSDLILKGQITSIMISLILVIILLSIMFKSIKVGLIGSVPIIITAFISFGVMGLLNIPLTTTTALLSSIAIGIGVDYAVHFIERYKINSSELEKKSRVLETTLDHTGRAILYNAMVVIAGFLVLLFSSFPANRALGALVSLNMITSFIGTLTIMAVFLESSKIKFDKNN